MALLAWSRGVRPRPTYDRAGEPGRSADALSTDESLLERSRNDAAAFSTLIDRHSGHIRRYLRGRVEPGEVEDALADLWETGFRQRHTFDPALGSATGWLYGIARNVTIHARRRSARRYELIERLLSGTARRPHSLDPADAVVNSESLDRLRVAIDTLPVHEREVAELIFWRQASYGLTAELLGLPVGTVRSRLARARSRLRSATFRDE